MEEEGEQRREWGGMMEPCHGWKHSQASDISLKLTHPGPNPAKILRVNQKYSHAHALASELTGSRPCRRERNCYIYGTPVSYCSRRKWRR